MKLLVLVTALLACSRQPKPSSGPWIARVDYSHYVVDRARVMAFLDRKPLEVPGVEPDPAGGLVVRASDPEWARAGLRDGDRIVEISGLPVRSLDDVKAVIRRLDGARALILGVSRAQHVALYEYRFGDPGRDAPFSDPEIHSLADVVRKYWVTRVDDEHYQVDLAALGLLAVCAGPPLSIPGTAALKSKLPFATDAGACEAIGVKRGDKLVTLDGKTIASGDDFLNVIDGEIDHVAVELERAGARVHLSYAVRAASRTHPGEPLVSHPEILLFASHPSATPTGPDATAIARGVRRVDADHVEMDRALRDAILAGPGSMARLVPSIRDGRANGFKLYAIRPNGAAAAVGLQNGDTLQVVNGEPIDTPDRGLAVWNKLFRAQHITVEGERRGERFKFTINIVDKK